ncbi:ATP F0F1 synthase subunit alpha [Mycoplasma iguanae]|uniref:ATP F0F1 synthase subunit alpha n=1 Tax=Mycoplasma iguanae TaxID=292461 RepID=A0ABY5RA46_9MOLU|nr:ATP F0F1 synthase subunit alpha [Mycoplasma iguanae]UVD81654.1 ATP F0F1 synthase subunit alpha [Mycoplasma iguanae]
MSNNPKIKAILDYVIIAEGNYPYQQEQFFEIKNKPGLTAFLLSANENEAFLLIDSSFTNYAVGDELVELKNYSEVATPKNIFGKVVNYQAEILLPQPEKKSKEVFPMKHHIFSTALNMMQRKKLNEQLKTGILSIDLFNPIGLGQRQSIIGDKQTGKTHIILNTIINQSKLGVKCIYVSIGQNHHNLNNVYQTLEKYNALDNVIIFEAPATSQFQQFLIPYFAMAHAENLSKDYDVLIVFDDLTKHANIYRETSLLIDKPIGKEAFPGDIFFAHSRILEKSGKFIDRKSITCLPIVQTVDNDITSLISSNIISITDGQIILNSNIFAEGRLPAIDLDISVSRTGTSVQSKNIAKISSDLLKIYRAYKRQSKLSNLNYELNKEISTLIYKGKSIEGILNQRGFNQYSEKTILISGKLIAWGILQHVEDKFEAIKFVYSLIKHERNAIQIYKNLLNAIPHDDEVLKNYFAWSLNQYFQYKNINDRIPTTMNFIPFNPEQLTTVIENMEEWK